MQSIHAPEREREREQHEEAKSLESVVIIHRAPEAPEERIALK